MRQTFAGFLTAPRTPGITLHASCTYYPASQTLVGTGNDTALFYYVPASGGVDIYCNGQYAGTNLGSATYFYPSPNTKIEIDTTLNSSGGSNWLYENSAHFGHSLYFEGWDIADAAFILGSGANLLTINGTSSPQATVVGWGPTSVVVDASTSTFNETFTVTPSKIYSYFDTLANLYSVGYVELRTGSGNDQFFAGNPGNSLGTMPLTYVKGGTGTDSITLEASDTTGEKYWFTEIGVNMANWSKDVLYYQNAENVTLNAGSGNDQITISSNSLTLAGVPPITVNGGAGTDSITFYDNNASHGNAYTMTNTSLIAWGNSTFSYSAVEALTLHAASGSNTISINGTPSGATTTVNAGGGHDTISVAAISGLYSDIGGPLTIDGGAGTDSLTIYDHLSPEVSNSEGYAVSATAVTITGLPTTMYNAFEALTFNVGERYGGVEILSTLAGGPTVINGVSTGHFYVLCPITQTLESLGGPLTLNGSADDVDFVSVHDTLSASNSTYTINSTSMARTGAQSVTYNFNPYYALYLYAGAGNNLINLNVWADIVYGGDGDDTLVAGGTVGLVSGFGPVNFHGQAGTDQMVINDANSVANDAFLVYESFVKLPNGWQLFHFTTESVSIQTGSGNSTITIQSPYPNGSLGSMPPTTISGGSGTDTVTLESLDTTGEKYHFTELGVHMANWGKDILYYQAVENVTLKAGTGNDEITVGNNANKLENLPIITSNGGGGNDTIILNDTGWVGGRGYYLTELGLAVEFGTYMEFIFYTAVENVTLKAGMGDDGIHVRSSNDTLDGIPELTIDGGGGYEQVIFWDINNPIGNTYTLTESQLLMPKSHGVVATFANVSSAIVNAGLGADILNIAPTSGNLLDMFHLYYVGGGPTTDIVNIYDHKNPNVTTYTVWSSGPGYAHIEIPSAGTQYNVQSAAVVNLYVKKGSIIDTTNYNPAHHKLNVYYRLLGNPIGTSSGDPEIGNGPPPAPPAPPVDQTGVSTTLATPVPGRSPRRILAVESGERSLNDNLAFLQDAATGIELDWFTV